MKSNDKIREELQQVRAEIDLLSKAVTGTELSTVMLKNQIRLNELNGEDDEHMTNKYIEQERWLKGLNQQLKNVSDAVKRFIRACNMS